MTLTTDLEGHCNILFTMWMFMSKSHPKTRVLLISGISMTLAYSRINHGHTFFQISDNIGTYMYIIHPWIICKLL